MPVKKRKRCPYRIVVTSKKVKKNRCKKTEERWKGWCVTKYRTPFIKRYFTIKPNPKTLLIMGCPSKDPGPRLTKDQLKKLKT